jgi:predicted transcriptional regulator
VNKNQNITLNVSKDLLKRVKRIAAEREVSVSSLMTAALDQLADEDERYEAARKRWTGAVKRAQSLGTEGRRTWSRNELHER